MTKLIQKKALFIAIGVAGLLAATTASAQIGTNMTRANIPFEFIAGGKTLPAGTYTMEVDRLARRMQLRSAEGSFATHLTANITYRTGSLENGALLFHRYGDTWVLRKLWNPGQAAGSEMPVTKRERELARNASAPAEIASVRTWAR